MGHRIAILNEGELQQVAPPQEVYARPANLFVARFIGNPPMNTVEGKVVASSSAGSSGDELTVELPGGNWPLSAEQSALVRAAGLEKVAVGVRPEHLRIEPEGTVEATVAVVEELGHEQHVLCRLNGDAAAGGSTTMIARQGGDASPLTIGDAVRLGADPRHLHLFDPDGTGRVEDL